MSDGPGGEGAKKMNKLVTDRHAAVEAVDEIYSSRRGFRMDPDYVQDAASFARWILRDVLSNKGIVVGDVDKMTDEEVCERYLLVQRRLDEHIAFWCDDEDGHSVH